MREHFGDGKRGIDATKKMPGAHEARLTLETRMQQFKLMRVKRLSPGWHRIGCGVFALGFAWLSPAQTLDANFNPGVSNGFPSYVTGIAIQNDGKIVVGGRFAILDGQIRPRLGRLHPEGGFDTTFNPASLGNSVDALGMQSDGKILAGGSFFSLAGQAADHIGRLNPDGTADVTFNVGAGAGGPVTCLLVQRDGRVVVGGNFFTFRGNTRNRICRVNPDGTLDSAFNPGANGVVTSLAEQEDGKILVGGSFTALGGESRLRIARLDNNGVLDTEFNPGADNTVHCLAVQADGMILVGGAFTDLAGEVRRRVGRISSSGGLDAAFNPDANDQVYSLSLQTDGKILIGGDFTTLAGQTNNRIARLRNDGSLDPSFSLDADGTVYSLALQADGKFLVGGSFASLGGEVRAGIGRVVNTDMVTNELGFAGTTVNWQRAGSSPEVWRTNFEVSTNGDGWVNLGGGLRTSDGWRALAGFEIPSNATIRARGLVAAGYRNGSSYVVEKVVGPPVVTNQPASRTNNFGTVATFTALADGGTPISYQWLKEGESLTNGDRVSGVTTPTLTLSNVFGGDAGGYSLVASNSGGVMTSRVAMLTVNDPLISAWSET